MSFLSQKQARFTQLAILTLCLFTGTACSQTNKETTQMTYSNPYNLEFSEEKFSKVQDTDKSIHFNPNPKKVYEITMNIQNSPIPLIPFSTKKKILSAMVHYYSPTEYNTNPVFSLQPGTSLKVPITKVDDNTYKFILIEDALLDEDYGLTHNWHKIGVSHWEMEGDVFQMFLSPTGQIQASYLRFMPFWNTHNNTHNMEQYVGHHTFFYEKKYVTTEPPLKFKDGSTYGRDIVELTSDELKNVSPSEIFSINLTVKKLF